MKPKHSSTAVKQNVVGKPRKSRKLSDSVNPRVLSKASDNIKWRVQGLSRSKRTSYDPSELYCCIDIIMVYFCPSLL